MISAEIKQALDNQQTALVVLWVAFILSLVIYLYIPEMVFPQAAPAAIAPLSDPIRLLFWGAALGALVFLFWWRRRYLDKPALLARLRGEGAASLFAIYLGRKVVAFAVAESLALLGLVLVFLGHYFWDQYLLSVLSAALLIAEFPTRVFLEEFIKEAEKARPS